MLLGAANCEPLAASVRRRTRALSITGMLLPNTAARRCGAVNSTQPMLIEALLRLLRSHVVQSSLLQCGTAGHTVQRNGSLRWVGTTKKGLGRRH